MYLEEAHTTVSLTIQRTLGTFGQVSVFVFAQQKISSASGAAATRGEDFDFDAGVREIIQRHLAIFCSVTFGGRDFFVSVMELPAYFSRR